MMNLGIFGKSAQSIQKPSVAGMSEVQAPYRRRRARPVEIDPKAAHRPDLTEPDWHLDCIKATRFRRTPLLDDERRELFDLIEDIVAWQGYPFRVMSQVALSKLVSPLAAGFEAPFRAADARHAISRHRVDFAILDLDANVQLVIEYQEPLSYVGTAQIMNAVTRETLAKADIPAIAVRPDFTLESLRKQIQDVLGPPS